MWHKFLHLNLFPDELQGLSCRARLQSSIIFQLMPLNQRVPPHECLYFNLIYYGCSSLIATERSSGKSRAVLSKFQLLCIQEGKKPSWNFCRSPGAPWAPYSWVFQRSQLSQHPHFYKELGFSPQMLQKTTVVALGVVLPAQQGGLIPEEIPVFPGGWHSLEVTVASDTSTKPRAELRFKYFISKGIGNSSVCLFWLLKDKHS